MSDKVNNSYRSIVKATGIFGMMQFIKLIIGIVSSKFVAIFLGPIGIGLVSLLTNALNIVLAITNFEFLRTATREVALNHDENDNSKVSNTLVILQKMAIVIGFLGAIIVIVFSKILSFYTFGNYNRQNWFILLSIYLLISSYSNLRMAVLQGINNIKRLALCNIIIALLTSVGSVIIYYFYRIEGIIWVLLYSSFVMLVVTVYFTRKFTFSFLPINFNEFYKNSSPVFKLGFLMSLNLIFGQISFFVIRLFLNDNGASSEILGFYEVNSVILINYVGLIFNAMSYDFFPKLAAISKDNSKMNLLVNNQIEIAIIVITPAIIFLYVMAPYVIQLLYSKAFLDTFIILKMSLFSVILKAIIFPLGYMVLVKGNKKLFFKLTLIGDIINLAFSIILYYYFGLTGLGLAFILNYLFNGIYIYFIVKNEYKFEFDNESKRLIVINVILGFLAVVFVYCFLEVYSNILLTLLFVTSLLFSYVELNKRIDIKGFIMKKINKIKK